MFGVAFTLLEMMFQKLPSCSNFFQFVMPTPSLPSPLTQTFVLTQWEVADAVLEVFHKLLRDYEPQPSDFVQEVVELQGEQIAAHKPPGHSIMFHLLNDSPTLALCLSLLEEGVRQLDTYTAFPGEASRVPEAEPTRCALDMGLLF